MLVDKQNELMSDLLFTVNQHGVDDVTWKPHWIILHWYACGADGRSVYGHVITKFSRMGSLPHFFTHGAPPRNAFE